MRQTIPRLFFVRDVLGLFQAGWRVTSRILFTALPVSRRVNTPAARMLSAGDEQAALMRNPGGDYLEMRPYTNPQFTFVIEFHVMRIGGPVKGCFEIAVSPFLPVSNKGETQCYYKDAKSITRREDRNWLFLAEQEFGFGLRGANS